MRRWNPRWMILPVALSAAVLSGCPGGDTNPPDGNGTETNNQQERPLTDNNSAAVVTPIVITAEEEEPQPSAEMPEVLLADSLRQTCTRWIGDPLPSGQLPDQNGQAHSLDSLRGEKLTVVFFWKSGGSRFSAMAARAELEDIQKDVVEPYQDKGLRVFGINQGDTPEVVGQLASDAGVAFPNLLDSEGAFFAQVATGILPRLYLLDAEGKILWLDLEFSEFSGITRDKLIQAIRFVLEQSQ